MRVFYGLIITAVILMIGACALKAYKKEGALARVVFLYELGAFICGIIFLVYTYVPGTTITVLCKGLIMASFDWLLVLLMYYTQYYTGMFKGVMGVKVFMIAYSLFETVAFLINAWTRWIFDITDISGDQIIVQFAKGNVLGRLHYVFAYGIMLLLILSYLVMVKRMSRFYRFRYFAILILLFAAFLLDIMTTWSDSIYDMSMVAFGIMSVLIYYLTYSYVPNELIENTFSLIIRDMNSGIICFDNAGRCIYCNGIVKEMYSITDNINEVEHNYASWLQTQTEHDNKKFRQTISEGKERRSFDISYNRVYDDKLLKRTLEERRVIGEFEGALERKEFKMFLQPQVNTHGKVYGAEALVRWQHPDRGLLSPFFFIDILETTGLIYKLDMYMWECAAAKLSEWKKKGDTVHYISVNISTKDFYLIDVYEVITSIVKKYDIEPKMLKLEITETALMSDLKKNMEVIKNLRGYGFKIEIDDFGSGYSSLNMLKDISADVLKIDMAFLRATENEVKGQDILETIISLGGKLGMEVITEGVETDKQLLMLTEMGCHIFQGYYFSKPIPVEEFEQKYMNE